jgi:hypothetical protein
VAEKNGQSIFNNPTRHEETVVFQNRLKKPTPALLAAALVGITIWAAAGSAQGEEKYGYDDTPMLPDSQWRVHDRERPQPPMVDPGAEPGDPPADAIVLFDGKDLVQWEGGSDDSIADGAINMLKTDGLSTKQKFGDCQLHAEWATPAEADGGPMNWGNSGIFFMGLYELQIIESHAGRIYADGITGSIYGQFPPLVNASRKPGQWQAFDAVFTAPRFDGEKLVEPARLTVFWNGVLVQYHQAILGSTQHKTFPTYTSQATTGPLVLQKHNSAVRLRNIWIRPLTLEAK